VFRWRRNEAIKCRFFCDRQNPATIEKAFSRNAGIEQVQERPEAFWYEGVDLEIVDTAQLSQENCTPSVFTILLSHLHSAARDVLLSLSITLQSKENRLWHPNLLKIPVSIRALKKYSAA
jgi:hypothetical protein